jgi:hypothetical protein
MRESTEQPSVAVADKPHSRRASDHSDRVKHGDTRALLQVDATNSSAATHVLST